ncbi:MAG TPA: hypothetical protein VGW37_01245 [Terriglobia bacterium]|nr:hypothetical protein [Terriglobia bacterium]
MKRYTTLAVIIAAVFLSLSIFAAARPKTQTWTGWISDSVCGAKGMSASHKDCATACVNGKGAKWVFVNSQTKEVFPIQNQDAVQESDLDAPVQVTGSVVKGKSLHVENIQQEN